MTNLETQSDNQLRRPGKWLTLPFLLISFLGFADSAYLTVKFYLKTPIPCSVFNGCDTVTTSIYATLYGIPIALFGALYYLTLFVLAIAYFDIGCRRIIACAAWITPIGFLVSLRLVYLQVFTLKALCLYCILSAVSSTALFFIGIALIRFKEVPEQITNSAPE